MKISTLILTLLVVSIIAALAFSLGRIFERMAAVQTEIGGLAGRVSDLEQVNARRELKWKWVKRIGSHLPVVGKHIGQE
jgi:hypothetical protein